MDELGRSWEVVDAQKSEAIGDLFYLLLCSVNLPGVEELLDGDEDLLADGNRDLETQGASWMFGNIVADTL